MIENLGKYVLNSFTKHYSPGRNVHYFSLENVRGLNDSTNKTANSLCTYFARYALTKVAESNYELQLALTDELNDLLTNYVHLPWGTISGSYTFFRDAEELTAGSPTLEASDIADQSYLESLIILHPYWNQFLVSEAWKIYIDESTTVIDLNGANNWTNAMYKANIDLFKDKAVTDDTTFNNMLLGTAYQVDANNRNVAASAVTGLEYVVRAINNSATMPFQGFTDTKKERQQAGMAAMLFGYVAGGMCNYKISGRITSAFALVGTYGLSTSISSAYLPTNWSSVYIILQEQTTKGASFANDS